MDETIIRKRGVGAPRSNENALTHGLYPAKAAVKRFGSRAFNKRNRYGREWKFIYVDFLGYATDIPVAELTREKQIRAAEKSLSRTDIHDIQALASEAFIRRQLDTNLVQAESLVRKRDKTTIPLIADRRAAHAAYEAHLAAFRARFAKAKPSFHDFIRQRSTAAPVTPATPQPGGPTSTQQRTALQEFRDTPAPCAIAKNVMPAAELPDHSPVAGNNPSAKEESAGIEEGKPASERLPTYADRLRRARKTDSNFEEEEFA